MSYKVTEFEATPNPNAIKCWVDRPIGEGVRSFRDAEEAQGDPIAAALFEGGGVANLFFNGDWFTVNKTPEADWGKIRKRVKTVLAAAGA